VVLSTGSVGLLSDARPNLSEVSTSAVILSVSASAIGLRRRATPRLGTRRGPCRTRVALVVWASAVFAGIESVRKLLSDQGTSADGVLPAAWISRWRCRTGAR
jgi:Co/Zn/Cd efflux system component